MTSLNPSASFYVKNRSDRPSYTPMRSASMRETSYSRSIRRSRMRTNNANADSLSVANAQGNNTSTTNVAIEEVNSNGHGED